MRRLVVDANILASGSVDPHSDSPPSLIVNHLRAMRFEAIVCPELLEEVADTLHKPYFLKRLSGTPVNDIITAIAEASTQLENPSHIEAILPDPADDYIVALARTATAQAIISGDKHFLEHPGLQPPAINPRAGCELLGLLEPPTNIS